MVEPALLDENTSTRTVGRCPDNSDIFQSHAVDGRQRQGNVSSCKITAPFRHRSRTASRTEASRFVVLDTAKPAAVLE